MTKSSKYEIKAVESHSDFNMVTITGSDSAIEYAKQFYHDDINIYESAFIMLLNRGSKVVGWAKISQGGISETSVDIKIICKYALDTLASGVILVHNHPSGNPKPGLNDLSVTKRLKSALNLLDISLLDHVIITDEGGCYSFTDESII